MTVTIRQVIKKHIYDCKKGDQKTVTVKLYETGGMLHGSTFNLAMEAMAHDTEKVIGLYNSIRGPLHYSVNMNPAAHTTNINCKSFRPNLN